MDNDQEKESGERKGVNTEYQPTKCRVTKPPPPKPATNPLQFIRVAPCPLFQKAHEQIKKVEQIKKERKETREEAEDWQQNLDNWKSCRRKRQEHIIERVVEVKKLEQEEHEKNRRRTKTFSEMMEDRGRHKFAIPIYDDDSNDLSDYGIGSSSSKANSLKDNDTDDSSSLLDDKDYLNKESNVSNQSQSEDETKPTKNDNNNTESFTQVDNQIDDSHKSANKSNKFIPKVATNGKPAILSKKSLFENSNGIESSFHKETEQYTYEGAIQDYRSRIQSKIHVDESIFTKNKNVSKSKEFSEAQAVVPKGEIFKRKELFESEKHIEINHMESNSSRRLSEDFANSKSIKDRLKSLEMSTDHSAKKLDKNDIQVSVKQRLENLNKLNETDNKPQSKPAPNKISNYLLDKSQSTPSLNSPTNKSWKVVEERSSSPETELYMTKLNMFNQEFDNLVGNKPNLDHLEDYSNYPPSTSSIELTGLSSDREDSGIHTADVSCSVSQADEAIDTDTEFNTIPNCIDKLNKEKELINKQLKSLDENNSKELPQNPVNVSNLIVTKEIVDLTKQFLDMEIKEACNDFEIKTEKVEILKEIKNPAETVNYNVKEENLIDCTDEIHNGIPENLNGIHENEEVVVEPPKSKPIIYENVDFNYDFNNFIVDTPFTLPPKTMEPPKVKPPPPPPESEPQSPIRRLNSTKRIKKEIHIKRSSFLGLDEPTDDQIDPEMVIDKPPDINSFLQKESKSEKSLYKKILEENRLGGLSKVESQDSGLDIDRGRLSSDTWCSSSIGESGTHERQDSEQTNSITSEEDEITKKEREIIEMVEKEEKSRDNNDFTNHDNHCKEKSFANPKENDFDANLGSDQFKNPYFPPNDFNIDDQDSEVLKVEHELRQLEQEELERQRENLLFRESRFKARLNNRRSLENICDEIYPNYIPENDYRKSMPELQLSPLKSELKYRPVIDNVSYRKSMPDIQHNYQLLEPRNKDNYHPVIDHRKSMPELGYQSAFKSPPVNRQPIMPGKPLRAKDALLFNSTPTDISRQPLSKNNLQALSAIPRNRHVQGDNWIQPKANPEAKSYNQHWLFQEAELRRLSDQQKNRWQSQQRPEKHLPDAIIQSLTQRVQTRSNLNNNNNDQRNQIRRSETTPNIQHQYNMNHQTMGHALPRNYGPSVKDETPDRMLSVSGKKKCSYCGNELGRGAAMIIESLCLFYHMECFKCCVCHMQLGNGLMGTDVRVRNQKLHCHNCYSSDDGVKFSCV